MKNKDISKIKYKPEALSLATSKYQITTVKKNRKRIHEFDKENMPPLSHTQTNNKRQQKALHKQVQKHNHNSVKIRLTFDDESMD